MTHSYETQKLHNAVISFAPDLGILKDWIHRENVVKMRRPLPKDLTGWLQRLRDLLPEDVAVSTKVTESVALHRPQINIVVTLTATA